VAETTWETREIPILEAIAAAEQAGEDELDLFGVAERLGMPFPLVQRTVQTLYDEGYLTGHDISVSGTGFNLFGLRLLGLGKRAVKQWPGDSYEAFLQALERHLTKEQDPEKRKALGRLLSDAREVGKGVLIAVLSEAARAGIF
jgi:hypothetical protein